MCTRVTVLIVVLVFVIAAPLVSAQTGSPAHEIPAQHPSQAAVSTDDSQALREDIQRMKSLVYQMERNLASISSAQDPLKHQFQLEIDMWQMEIARMERRLGSAGAEEPRK